MFRDTVSRSWRMILLTGALLVLSVCLSPFWPQIPLATGLVLIAVCFARFWRMIPLPTALLLIAVCFAVRENFPFSHFPMYSSFSDYSYYVYFTDSKDEPVPILDLSGHKTSGLKKIYDKRLEKDREKLEKDGVEIEGFRFMTREQREAAAKYTLQWIYDNTKENRKAALDARRPLRLYHMHLRYEEGETVEESEFIAELP